MKQLKKPQKIKGGGRLRKAAVVFGALLNLNCWQSHKFECSNDPTQSMLCRDEERHQILGKGEKITLGSWCGAEIAFERAERSKAVLRVRYKDGSEREEIVQLGRGESRTLELDDGKYRLTVREVSPGYTPPAEWVDLKIECL